MNQEPYGHKDLRASELRARIGIDEKQRPCGTFFATNLSGKIRRFDKLGRPRYGLPATRRETRMSKSRTKHPTKAEQLAEFEAAPLEDAKPKRKRARKSDGPVAVSEVLPNAIAHIPEFPADGQLRPPEPASQATTAGTAPEIAPEPAMTHVERVTGGKPTFAPVPDEFRTMAGWRPQGIKVNWSMDKRTVALQFAEDRTPTRAEKDILEALHEPNSETRDRIKFSYNTGTRQWERYDAARPGANLIDAKTLAEELAKDRAGHLR